MFSLIKWTIILSLWIGGIVGGVIGCIWAGHEANDADRKDDPERFKRGLLAFGGFVALIIVDVSSMIVAFCHWLSG